MKNMLKTISKILIGVAIVIGGLFLWLTHSPTKLPGAFNGPQGNGQTGNASVDLAAGYAITLTPSPITSVGTIAVNSSTIGSQISTALATQSNIVAQTLLVQNNESVLNADQFPGLDIDAKINAAYLALPASGGEIFVPAGQYNATVPIVFNTSGKAVLLMCASGGGLFNQAGTNINFIASTGTLFSYDVQNYVSAGTGITNCNFIGPAGTGNAGSSNPTSTIAVNLGGSHGAFGFHLDSVHISGFGTGLSIGQNVSFLNVTNSVINKNGREIESDQASGANGENMRVTNTVLADSNAPTSTASSISQFCVYIQLSGNVQWTFENTSFDDCQLYSTQFGGTANIFNLTDDHFEDPNTSGSNAYPYIVTQASAAGAAAVVINIKGGDLMQDLTSSLPNEFIQYGGQLVVDGATGDINNNVGIPVNDFATPLNASATFQWTGLQNQAFNTGTSTAFKFVYASTTYTPDGYVVGSSTNPTYSVVGNTFFQQCLKTVDHSTTTVTYNWVYSSGTALVDTASKPSFCSN